MANECKARECEGGDTGWVLLIVFILLIQGCEFREELDKRLGIIEQSLGIEQVEMDVESKQFHGWLSTLGAR